MEKDTKVATKAAPTLINIPDVFINIFSCVMFRAQILHDGVLLRLYAFRMKSIGLRSGGGKYCNFSKNAPSLPPGGKPEPKTAQSVKRAVSGRFRRVSTVGRMVILVLRSVLESQEEKRPDLRYFRGHARVTGMATQFFHTHEIRFTWHGGRHQFARMLPFPPRFVY